MAKEGEGESGSTRNVTKAGREGCDQCRKSTRVIRVHFNPWHIYEVGTRRTQPAFFWAWRACR